MSPAIGQAVAFPRGLAALIPHGREPEHFFQLTDVIMKRLLTHSQVLGIMCARSLPQKEAQAGPAAFRVI